MYFLLLLLVGTDAGRSIKVYTRGLHLIQFGDEELQLSGLEQLVDKSQTRAVAEALKWIQKRMGQQQGGGGGRTLRQLLQELEVALDEEVRRDVFSCL